MYVTTKFIFFSVSRIHLLNTDGQTGSGKTHTMMGSEDNKGIIPRLNDELFRAVRDKLESFKGDGDTKFMITVIGRVLGTIDIAFSRRSL